MTKDHS